MPVARGVPLLDRLAPPIVGAAAGRVASRLREQAIVLARDERLARGAWAYRIVPLERVDGDQLRFAGSPIEAPRLLPRSGRLTAAAFGVCTLGGEFDARVRALMTARRMSLGLALDALGNELLLALTRLLQDRVTADARRSGLDVSGELRAGDPGLDLAAQPAVLRLAGAASIGLGLSGAGMMQPAKSASMMLGVGVDLPPADWSRCDDCPSRARCRIAQSSSRTARAAAAFPP